MSEGESVYAINGRIGALESWARLTKTQRTRRTEAPREGLLQKFAKEADPEGRMSEAERMAAAEKLWRAHMLRIAQASVRARASKGQKK